MQPPSGGFLEAVPLTSFVVMSLASTGRAEHAVVRRGVGFLLDVGARRTAPGRSTPNLAVWNTTLAISALAAASGDVGALGCLDWLLGRPAPARSIPSPSRRRAAGAGATPPAPCPTPTTPPAPCWP